MSSGRRRESQVTQLRDHARSHATRIDVTSPAPLAKRASILSRGAARHRAALACHLTRAPTVRHFRLVGG